MDKRIKEIYNLRNSFSIIGITGRKGAGVDITAEILSNSFEGNNFPKPKADKLSNNDRKYKILYNFSKENWRKYKIISYKKVLFLHLLRFDLKDYEEFIKTNPELEFDSKIKNVLKKYNNLSKKIKALGKLDRSLKERKKLIELSEIFFGVEFNKCVDEIEDLLKENFIIKRIKFLQKIANNLRQTGNPYNSENIDNTHIYTIAETINRIIKGYKYNNDETHIIINSLRNSLEIMFFKERYSAFYMFAINSDKRKDFLTKRFKDKDIVKEILKLDEQEYKGEYDDKKTSNGDFFIQDVQNCIQKSDIYLSLDPYLSKREKSKSWEFEKYEKFSIECLKTQLLRYTSLILHPGLVTPSAQERCMQIAFNAKSNSGCISRQVGAAITDEDFFNKINRVE